MTPDASARELRTESAKSAAPASAAAAGAAAKSPSKEDKEKARVIDAAKQFEGIFVRQLLDSAKIMGPKGSSGYGSMAVESLADGVVRAGGLGLARQIESALAGPAFHTKVPSEPTETAATAPGTPSTAVPTPAPLEPTPPTATSTLKKHR